MLACVCFAFNALDRFECSFAFALTLATAGTQRPHRLVVHGQGCRFRPDPPRARRGLRQPHGPDSSKKRTWGNRLPLSLTYPLSCTHAYIHSTSTCRYVHICAVTYMHGHTLSAQQFTPHRRCGGRRPRCSSSASTPTRATFGVLALCVTVLVCVLCVRGFAVDIFVMDKTCLAY